MLKIAFSFIERLISHLQKKYQLSIGSNGVLNAKITVPSHKRAKFVAVLTHLAFPFFPSGAEVQQADV